MENRKLRMRKSGSALLIVLGFLSFMVVSAISFSIYMRSERAPSSALRQGVATRFLVKAALAQAMSRVDDAIRNDPFPGVSCEYNRDRRYQTKVNGRSALYNYWEGRVFMPPNNPKIINGVTEDGTTATEQNQTETRFAPHSETISVLNLEALGHLPPDLVNDVRFLSRSSWASKWNYFNYDAGRFAYCAVNVSDYFDVTQMKAFAVRNSSYDGRITMSSFFTDNNYQFSTTEAQNFDNFVGNPSSLSDVPFISMLDYNLACWARFGSGSTLFSPFCWWVDGSGAKQFFYTTNVKPVEGDTGSFIARAKRQPFIIGSLSANEAGEGLSGASQNNQAQNQAGYLNLLEDKYQPFDKAILEYPNATVRDVYQQADSSVRDPFWSEATLRYLSFGNNREGTFIPFMLYDYLDRNDLPLSLAMPCVERVPSVAALAMKPNFQMGLQPKLPGAVSETETLKETRIPYELQFPRGVTAMRAVVNYPFQSQLAEKFYTASGYRLEYVVKAFLAVDQSNSSRTVPPSLRVTDGLGLKPLNDRSFWTSRNEFPNSAFVLTSQLKNETLKYDDIMNPEQCVDMTLDFPNSVNGRTILTKIEKEQKTTDANGITTTKKLPAEYFFDIKPVEFNGNSITVNQMFNNNLDENAFNELLQKQCKLYFAVWARIRDNNDKTVDMVPATVDDDNLENAVNNDDQIAQTFFGSAKATGFTPLIVFESQNTFTLSQFVGNGTTAGSVSLTDCQNSVLYTVDSRFNHAPENWFIPSGDSFDGLTYNRWLQNGPIAAGLTQEVVNQTVSNQGYLQSLAELAALPRVLTTQPNALTTPFDGVPRQNTSVANLNHMRQNIGLWELYVGETDKDVYPKHLINPYTDNDEIFKSVLAFTPYDWWVAGTNYTGSSSSADASFKNDNVSQNIKYTYSNEGNTELGLGCADLRYITQVAPLMRKYIRNQYIKYGKTWEVAYDEFCHAWLGVPEMRRGRKIDYVDSNQYVTDLGTDSYPNGSNNSKKLTGFDSRYDDLVNLLSDQTDVGDAITKAETIANALSPAEKKFLYSFWRSCFGVDRQLFFIFVRAEANALGGPGSGTPAQLGGRAVALVWRDPDPLEGGVDYTQKQNAFQNGVYNAALEQQYYDERRQPHRMRVLFYHQFE